MMVTRMSIIFSVHLLLRRKLVMITICLLFYDYGDENNFVEFAPTIVHVGSINSFTHVAHDRDALYDSYVSYIHDATESYYERGKHGLMDLNNIEFPLFLLEFLKLNLF
jgi:hypothetical protein